VSIVDRQGFHATDAKDDKRRQDLDRAKREVNHGVLVRAEIRPPLDIEATHLSATPPAVTAMLTRLGQSKPRSFVPFRYSTIVSQPWVSGWRPYWMAVMAS
jgi:hypothetical protein